MKCSTTSSLPFLVGCRGFWWASCLPVSRSGSQSYFLLLDIDLKVHVFRRFCHWPGWWREWQIRPNHMIVDQETIETYSLPPAMKHTSLTPTATHTPAQLSTSHTVTHSLVKHLLDSRATLPTTLPLSRTVKRHTLDSLGAVSLIDRWSGQLGQGDLPGGSSPGSRQSCHAPVDCACCDCRSKWPDLQ